MKVFVTTYWQASKEIVVDNSVTYLFFLFKMRKKTDIRRGVLKITMTTAHSKQD